MNRIKCAGFSVLVVIIAGFRLAAGETKLPENAMLDGKALAVIRSSIDFLKSTTTYSTTLTNKSTLEGGPGKKQESNGKYEISVERPNKLAMIIKDGDLRCSIISDGKALCTVAPKLKVYTQRDAPKTLEELFDIDEMNGLVMGDLSDLLFLNNFAKTNAFEMIMDGVLDLRIAGVETLDGNTKVDHLHFIEKELEWDMWIQQGPQPLLRKIIIVREGMAKDESGPVKVKKTVVSQFDNWKVNGELPKERFVYTPPSEVKRVPTFLEHPEDAKKPYDPMLLGQTAPQFVAKLLMGGTLDLSQHKDKNVVLLDFWATWCGPCRKAQPIVSEVCAGFKGKELASYAVNLKETSDKIKEFQTATPTLTLPIVLDEEGKIAEAYRVQPIPMTVLIGKSGVVEAVYLGLPNNLEAFKTNLKAQIETLLAGGTLLKKEGEAKK